jgi:glycosyltransferase involved in cell wall biosynthesis
MSSEKGISGKMPENEREHAPANKKNAAHDPAAAVIIAVYNKPDFLEKVLISLGNQSFQDFEILIADDGSGPEIGEVIKSLQSLFQFPIRHVRHDHRGFRKTIIVNKAVARASAEYLIFIDGDSILHHRFVESHFSRRKKRTILSGRRIRLDRELSGSLAPDDVRKKRLEKPALWWRHCQAGDRKHGFYIPGLFFWENLLRTRYSLLGCNFSLYREDFLGVNGYDERIIGRGMEDCNLNERLKLNRCKIRTLTRQALQYHLYHEFDPVPHSPEAIKSYCWPDAAWTPFGMDKSLSQ